MSDQNKRRLQKWATEGVSIAFISAVAYVYTYSYEMGYAQVFGIPIALIELNLTSMVAVMVLLLGLVLFFILSLSYIDVWKNMLFKEVFLDLLPDKLAGVLKIFLVEVLGRLYPLLLFVFAYILIELFFDVPNSADAVLTPILLIIIGGYISSQIIFYKPTRPEETVSSSKSTGSIFDNIPHVGIPGIIVVLVLFAGFYMAKYIGEWKAIHQRQYIVINTVPETVVLRIYGDKIVCAPFDNANSIAKCNA